MSKQQNDLAAFQTVLRQWGAKVYGLALRLSCRKDEAEDIAQETFLKALEHWQEFRNESETGTWLYRICVNVWKNKVRSDRRRAFWQGLSVLGKHFHSDGTSLDVAADEPALDSALESGERGHQLTQALQNLDPEERGILVMREIEDWSYERIAESLGVPLGTVKSRLARAREKLKQLYETMKPGEQTT